MRPRRIPLPSDTVSAMDDLDYLRRERLRTWEQAKALIDNANGRSLTNVERTIWNDLNARLLRLDNMLYRKAGSTNVTHWGGASGPPVSGGGGGGTGVYNIAHTPEQLRYYRSRMETRRNLGYSDDPLAAGNARLREAIREARDTADAATETAERVVKLAKSIAPKEPQPVAERTCAACGISEFSRIGAGPFTKDGVCRYCAELQGLGLKASADPKPKDAQQLWPLPLRILMGTLLLAIAVAAVSGVIVGIVELVALAGGH